VQRPKSTPIWAVGPACPVQPLSRERQPGPPNAYQLPGRTSKAHQAVTGSETTRARPARPVFPTAPHFEPVTHSATLYVLDSIIPMPPTESPLRSEHPYAEPGKTTRRALPLPLPLFIDRSSGRRCQSGRRGTFHHQLTSSSQPMVGSQRRRWPAHIDAALNARGLRRLRIALSCQQG
jgi:hypothetical protein